MPRERGELGDEYPESGEIIIGTVKEIFNQGAFITLDEYGNKRGLLHISEMSLKWVKNIRDYVREGQKVVLQVVDVKPERGHIDLSLRRVNDSRRREKLQEVKERQRANKLLELMAEQLNVSTQEVGEKVGGQLLKKADSIYGGLEAIVVDNKSADDLDLDERWKEILVKLVNENMKSPYVDITGYVKLLSYEPNGALDIKAALGKIEGYETDCRLMVSYDAPPVYGVKVRSRDYKTAERALRDAVEQGIGYIKKKRGTGEFYRELKSK